MSDLKSPIPLSYGSPASPGLDSPSEGIRVTLPDIAELKSLPECGVITFRYERESLRLSKESELSADIRLCAIVAVKGDVASEQKEEDTVDRLFEEANKEKAD